MNTFIETIQAESPIQNPSVKWDLCKVKIQEFCIEYSKNKSRQNKSKYKSTSEELNRVEKDLAENPDNLTLQKELQRLKLETEVQSIQHAKSAQMRSRAKFIEEGEKNTKYFLNIEKANANKKIMDRLINEEGNAVTSQQEIMKEQVKYFTKTFSKKGCFDENQAETFITNCDIPQVTKEQNDFLESEITEKYFAEALGKLNNGSSPGLDGIITSFL